MSNKKIIIFTKPKITYDIHSFRRYKIDYAYFNCDGFEITRGCVIEDDIHLCIQSAFDLATNYLENESDFAKCIIWPWDNYVKTNEKLINSVPFGSEPPFGPSSRPRAGSKTA